MMEKIPHLKFDMEEEKPSYESMYPRINAVIEKNKRRYQLEGVTWMGWEDVEQIIRIHIYKKWHMWDATKPLEPWINTITINQIKNIVRNNWSNYARPCLKCEFYKGDELCGNLRSGNIGPECPMYKKWMRGKRYAIDLKVSYSMTGHEEEISPQVEGEGMEDLILNEFLLLLEKEYEPLELFLFKKFFISSANDEEIIQEVKKRFNKKITLSTLKSRRREMKKDGAALLKKIYDIR